ncbi:hypothetical protein PsorP6_013714 [Peronosclerospora sorghi]|uniref:Uncharacterized protein n=1 Tax=Peronosclerospora sorghi TaxID=230839 RepID=A0ACC0VH44_9STRA|nr:hypothetical protein PsorP6_013714 [Peronosclerospora sorghi]
MASPDEAKWKEQVRSEIRSHICNQLPDIVTRLHGSKQYAIYTAFLNGELSETVFMDVPEGIRAAAGQILSVLEEPLGCNGPCLSYLKGTSTLGITFTRDNARIDNYCDTNWCGDEASRRSASDDLLKMTGGPTIFRSKSHATLALSSAEAEYVALDDVLGFR